MSEKGKIITRKSKKGKWIFEVDIGKKQPMLIPFFYDLKNDSLNGKECEVERENGQIVKILIDGKELPKKQEIEMKKTVPSNKKKYLHKQIYGKQSVQNIYSIQNTKLPFDTKNNLKESDIDNFSLKLNKTVNFIDFGKGEESVLYKNEYQEKIQGKKIKKKFSVEFDFSKLNNIIKRIKDKMDILKNSYESMGYLISKKEFSQDDWRLIVGLGSESVYETSITLHHIYGIPYIPGQAIKGVVRNWVIIEEFNQDENEALKDKGFCLVFGSPENSKIGEHKGNIIFFDAFPMYMNKENIKVDIMNPHYGDYYSGKKVNGDPVPPADYLNPNPIPFLTVEGTKFQFILGIKEKNNVEIDDGKFRGQNILEVVEKYLKEALEEHGIGAKTAVGYGYMKEK